MSPNAWGPIKQLAYIVEDLDASIRRWIELHGVGPWTVYCNTTMTGTHRGQPTSVKLHVGLSYQDGLQIELIQAVSTTPSPYQHDDGRPRAGLHHIAWHSQNLDSDVALAKARGLLPVFEASNGVVRVAYLEMPEESGPLYEFIEAVPLVSEGFAAGELASRRWDGVTQPLTVVDFENPQP